MKRVNALYGQNAAFLDVQAQTHRNHRGITKKGVAKSILLMEERQRF
jgi:hypothetical protein